MAYHTVPTYFISTIYHLVTNMFEKTKFLLETAICFSLEQKISLHTMFERSLLCFFEEVDQEK